MISEKKRKQETDKKPTEMSFDERQKDSIAGGWKAEVHCLTSL